MPDDTEPATITWRQRPEREKWVVLRVPARVPVAGARATVTATGEKEKGTARCCGGTLRGRGCVQLRDPRDETVRASAVVGRIAGTRRGVGRSAAKEGAGKGEIWEGRGGRLHQCAHPARGRAIW